MRVHYLKLETKQPPAAARATVGGRPVMAGGQEWPHCKLCKQRMVFFFQADIEKGSDVPIKPGSHLLVFMCPTHNDTPSSQLESGERNLPDSYWQRDFGHYRLFMNKSPKNEMRLEAEEMLAPRALKYIQAEEDIDWDGRVERGSTGFKIGGVPYWERDPEFPRCSCGSEMIFTCQVPPRFLFPKTEDAPEQPDGVRADGYCLFSGRATYVFVCKDQCTPYSLYAITQESRDDQAPVI